jgi:hypothetical protein
METERDLLQETVQEKMKATIVVHPRTSKQITIAIFMLIVILCGIVPIVDVFNKPLLILGIPLLMFWCIIVAFMTLVVMRLALRWGVH